MPPAARLASTPLRSAPTALRQPAARKLSAATARAPAARSARFGVYAVQTQVGTDSDSLHFEAAGTLEKIDSCGPADSLARQRYSSECEDALNEQINVEYNVSYIYHCMFAYFDRDNVGLPGFAKYFQEASVEEREHAEMMMKYQNLRGGKVKLLPIYAPVIDDFNHEDKGDALYAMELALALEKLNNEKLLSLHQVAVDNDDPQMSDYIESTFLEDQVQSINKVSKFVSELKRLGKGHGVWDMDKQLDEEAVA